MDADEREADAGGGRRGVRLEPDDPGRGERAAGGDVRVRGAADGPGALRPGAVLQRALLP